MSLKAFKKLSVDMPELNKIQDNVTEVLHPIIDSKIIDGILLTNVELLSADTTLVPHKLGRPLQGWVLVRNRANSVVWDGQDANLLKSAFVALNCSANTTVDLWVF